MMPYTIYYIFFYNPYMYLLLELIRLEDDILDFLFSVNEEDGYNLLYILDFLFNDDDDDCVDDSDRFFGILLAQDCNKALAIIY